MTEPASQEGAAAQGAQGGAGTQDASAIARRQDAERPPGIDEPHYRFPESRVSFKRVVSPGEEKPRRTPDYRLEYPALVL